MYKRIKQLFCKHDYKPWANVFGDFIHHMDGVRTVLYCPKCGKRKYIREFINAPLNYNAVWNYLAALKYEGEEFARMFAEDIFRDIDLYWELFGNDVQPVRKETH